MTRHHIYLVSVCFALVTINVPTRAAQFAGGSGTADDPYHIATAEQLDALGADPTCWDKYFKLIADIDLSGYGPAGFHTIGYWVTSKNYKAFTGVFDGDGHSISGFTGAWWSKNYAGLFRCVADPNAQIRNLSLVNPLVYAQAGDDVGSLVGYLAAGSVVNCHVKGGLVLGSDGVSVGLLVGSLVEGTISDCNVVDGMISGKTAVGGLVGKSAGTIRNCRVSGTVTGGQDVGGLVGELTGAMINCHASCTVLGDADVGGAVGLADLDSQIAECSSSEQATGATSVGGLVGLNSAAAIARSCSTADAVGMNGVGGLVGENQGTITNCYSLGRALGAMNVDSSSGRTLRAQADGYGAVGNNIGGLVGSNAGTVTYCYSAGRVAGRSGIGGLVGAGASQAAVVESFWDTTTSEQPQSAGGTGRTTDEMRTPETSLWWGACSNAGIWTIDASNDYPRLSWEGRFGKSLVVEPPEGEGTQNSPYLVCTAEELNRIGVMPCIWDRHFKLMADIDLAELGGVRFNPIGRYASTSGISRRFADETPIDQPRPFSGIFDGNGKAIRNFTYTSKDAVYVGLFAYVDGELSEIRDVTVIDPNLRADTPRGYAGALVGQLRSGTIADCRVEGGRIQGASTAGGIVGYSSGGVITGCCADAAVKSSDDAGGVAGVNYGMITDCYATGSVTGGREAGGLAGWGGGRIIHCYSTGVVAGEQNVGGLVGSCSDSTYVVRSFWDIQTSGQQSSPAGVGKTTTEMQTAATFLAWGGCSEEILWTIDEGSDYPRLAWEAKPGTPLAMTRLSDFLAGAGTQDDPYLIDSAEGLNAVGLFPCEWDKCFRLSTDIDLAGYSLNLIGDTMTPFTGVFDGDGHFIAHLTYGSRGAGSAGLFRVVSDPNAEIANVTLLCPDVNAPAATNVGSLAGQLLQGTIRHCAVDGGRVTGARAVGGLVGANGILPDRSSTAGILASGRVVDCWSSSSVVGSEGTGGLVGRNGSLVARCHATGNVSGGNSVGGLTGSGYSAGAISECYATGDVSGSGSRIAGLVGDNYGAVRACYASGRVRGRGQVGGLMGANWGLIASGYSLGRVDGDWDVGGLVGENNGSIMISYSAAEVSGKETAGGLAGGYSGKAVVSFWDTETSGQATSSCGVGITPAEMRDPNTFMAAGWDFIGMPDGPHDIWAMDPTTAYPILWWQLPESELPALTFSGGTGSLQDPYLISSAEELNHIGYNPRLMAAHFKLINSIDLAAVDLLMIGSQVCPFTGVFDGADLEISNFTCTTTQGSETGLFTFIDADEAVIRDLVLTTPEVNVPGLDYVGSLVGYLKRGAVTGCRVWDGSISGDYSVGGLIGRNGKGTIRDCRADITVAGEYAVGGLLGGNDQGSVMSSCSVGPVRAKRYVGGLVGSILAGSISDCYATGTATGELAVGGLVGGNDPGGIITNCYSAGAVVSDEYYDGGLVGDGWSGKACFWDIETSGRTTGYQGLGKTTAEMQSSATFVDAGWDFVNTWMICEGRDYPRLRWEGIVCGQ